MSQDTVKKQLMQTLMHAHSLHQSLIVKSKQNGIELVTRPGFICDVSIAIQSVVDFAVPGGVCCFIAFCGRGSQTVQTELYRSSKATFYSLQQK